MTSTLQGSLLDASLDSVSESFVPSIEIEYEAESADFADSVEAPLAIKPEVETPFAFLPEGVRAVLAAQGILTPTLIQERAIPIALQGHDVLAQSQTGSGKTLAFGLALALRLQEGKSDRRGVRGLILTPTRELADQVMRALDPVFRHVGLRAMAITGGASYTKQKNALSRGIDVVVATPGRLVDLLGQGELDVSSVRVFVLDEVDEMLDIGFADDLARIRQAVGEKAQALFFSATLNAKIRATARALLRDPVEVVARKVDSEGSATITHGYIEVAGGGEFKALINTFLYHAPEQALVFCETKAECGQLVEGLLARGLNAAALHGDLSQVERNATMAKFRDKRLQYLVATNVAARGIDVAGLPLVVNFTAPWDLETYTHRTGRTGRAGAEGKAWTIVTPRTARAFEFLMARLRLRPERIAVPAYAEITRRAADVLVERAMAAAPNADAIAELEIKGGESNSNKTVRKAVSRLIDGLDDVAKDTLLRDMLTRHLERNEGFYLHDVENARPIVRFDRDERRPAGGGGFGGGARPFPGKKPFGEKKPWGEKKAWGDKKPFGDKPFAEKKVWGEKKAFGDKPFAEKKPFTDKPFGEKKAFGKKPFGEKPFGEKPFGEKPFGEKPFGEKPFGEKRSFSEGPGLKAKAPTPGGHRPPN